MILNCPMLLVLPSSVLPFPELGTTGLSLPCGSVAGTGAALGLYGDVPAGDAVSGGAIGAPMVPVLFGVARDTGGAPVVCASAIPAPKTERENIAMVAV